MIVIVSWVLFLVLVDPAGYGLTVFACFAGYPADVHFTEYIYALFDELYEIGVSNTKAADVWWQAFLI